MRLIYGITIGEVVCSKKIGIKKKDVIFGGFLVLETISRVIFEECDHVLPSKSE